MLNNEDIGVVIYVILLLIKVKNPKHADIITGIFAIVTVVIAFISVCLFSLFSACIIIAIIKTFSIGDIINFNVDNSLNYGPSLENLVYLYLVSNGYQVSIGKIGDFECDFIVRKQNGDYAYIQVTYMMTGNQKIKEREYRPFRKIKNGYPRYIISLDIFKDQQEGVHHINAIDLFLGKEVI